VATIIRQKDTLNPDAQRVYRIQGEYDISGFRLAFKGEKDMVFERKDLPFIELLNSLQEVFIEMAIGAKKHSGRTKPGARKDVALVKG
jgi:hypothetical protein